MALSVILDGAQSVRLCIGRRLTHTLYPLLMPNLRPLHWQWAALSAELYKTQAKNRTHTFWTTLQGMCDFSPYGPPWLHSDTQLLQYLALIQDCSQSIRVVRLAGSNMLFAEYCNITFTCPQPLPSSFPTHSGSTSLKYSTAACRVYGEITRAQ